MWKSQQGRTPGAKTKTDMINNNHHGNCKSLSAMETCVQNHETNTVFLRFKINFKHQNKLNANETSVRSD